MLKISVTLAACFVLSGGSVSHDQAPEAVRYFKGFSGYGHPLKLINEMPEQQASKWNGSVYEGHYVDGRLVKAVKKHKNRVVALYRYRYSETGDLLEAEITGPDGVTKRISFGPSAKPRGK